MNDPAKVAMEFWMRAARRRLHEVNETIKLVHDRVSTTKVHIHNAHRRNCERCEGEEYPRLEELMKILRAEVDKIEEMLNE